MNQQYTCSFSSVVFVANVEAHKNYNQSMAIGEIGQHGHLVHVHVVVQYKNHNVFAIIPSKSDGFCRR